MGSSHSSAHDEFKNVPIKHIPGRYKPLEILGKGGCGVVIKCEDCKTKQTVAIKLSTGSVTLKREIKLLKLLNKTPHDDCFVKMLSAPMPWRYMVMEMLHMNFRDYVIQNAPMKLEQVRTVIEQLATALKYLRASHIIHADLKLNNIMLVDHLKQPLKVKVIDFGLAVLDYEATEELICQAYLYRAPEIMFNIPFSAAVDIWSLGCMMSTMVFGISLFPGKAVYDQLYYMTKLLGPAPQHILNASEETYKYFNLTNKNWVLQAPTVAQERKLCSNKLHSFTKLDEAKTIRLEPDNCFEAEERWECIELLKSMLKWDEKERITPWEILRHPFITKSFHKASRNASSCCKQQATKEEGYPSTSVQHESAQYEMDSNL